MASCRRGSRSCDARRCSPPRPPPARCRSPPRQERMRTRRLRLRAGNERLMVASLRPPSVTVVGNYVGVRRLRPGSGGGRGLLPLRPVDGVGPGHALQLQLAPLVEVETVLAVGLLAQRLGDEDLATAGPGGDA